MRQYESRIPVGVLCGALTVVVSLATGTPAHANLLIAMNDIFFMPPAVRRFSETNGAHLGVAATGGELVMAMAPGPDGRLYVAFNDMNRGFIKKFDIVTGAFLGDLASNLGWVPGRMRFGPDGNLYTTGLGGVRKLNRVTGQDLGVLIPNGVNGLVEAQDLVFQPGTNDLFVTDGRCVNRYNEVTGAFLSTFNPAAVSSPHQLRDMVFGPDGNLYANDVWSGASDWPILRFDGATGAPMGTVVAQQDGSRQIRFAFGPDGRIYSTVLISSMYEVRRYDGTSGAFIDTFIPPNPLLYTPFQMMFVTVPEPGAIPCAALAATTVMLRCCKGAGRGRSGRLARRHGSV